MGDFFRPWRRKIGVLTLFMACVFMAVWVRSMVAGDELTLRMAKHAHFLASYDGWFRWECYTVVPGIESSKFAVIARLRTQWLVEDPKSFEYNAPWRNRIEWQIDSCGLQLGTTNIDATTLTNNRPRPFQIPFVLFVAPHLYFVVPLTLISIWLLLSKPRKSTSNKIEEPILTEES